MSKLTPKHVSSKLRAHIDEKGVMGTLKYSITCLFDKYRQYSDNSIDRKFDIDTSWVESSYLNDVCSPNTEYAEKYESIKWRVFRDMINTASIKHDDYVFIDLGSGKAH